MSSISEILHVYDAQKSAVIADIILNGYDIAAGELHGKIRSFKIVNGNLREQWNVRAQMVLRHNESLELAVRVAALPVDNDSYGLLEFL